MITDKNHIDNGTTGIEGMMKTPMAGEGTKRYDSFIPSQ